MPETGHVSTHYEVVSEWRPPKQGPSTFDFHVAKRPVDSELDVPIVRDNLGVRPEAAVLTAHVKHVQAQWFACEAEATAASTA